MNLLKDDPKNFSLSVLKHLLSSMQRVQEGYLSSERTIQDVRKVICANISTIHEYQGVIIPNIRNKCKKLIITTEKKLDNQSSKYTKCTKKELKQQHICSNTLTARKEIISKAIIVKKEYLLKVEEIKNKAKNNKGSYSIKECKVCIRKYKVV